jgi:rhamnulokinase
MGQYLAFDLGAESGRAIVGTLSGGRLTVEELHRFANVPVREGAAMFWNSTELWHEVEKGIAIATKGRNLRLDGVGVDTWGVDFGLIGANGGLIGRPRHYRDPRNLAAMEELFRAVRPEEVFAYTGIQHMQINSLVQLYAMKLAKDPALLQAKWFLSIPDLFNYWLTGVARSETTIASTTEFFSPAEMTWCTELLKRLDLPSHFLCPLVTPGTKLGTLLDAPHIPVYATAGHDTAAAVAAAPSKKHEHWCYISSGTWSLLGLELDRPVMNRQAQELNVTNEVGVEGKIRLLKNIAGLWLLQECRRCWKDAGAEYSYEELARMAAQAPPFGVTINPDAFIEPGEMPAQIAAHCRRTGQEPPATHAEFARSILESLALRYRHVLEGMEKVADRRVEVIHIVGGGSKNTLLNQFVADCTGRRVIAGPSEATAIGNILVQAMGAGELSGLDAIRKVVRHSFPPVTVEPRPSAEWDRAYEKYRKIVG